jgi:hypothetical protein
MYDNYQAVTNEQYLYVTNTTLNGVTLFIIPLLGQWNISSYTHLLDKCCLQYTFTAAAGDATITVVRRRLTKLWYREFPV